MQQSLQFYSLTFIYSSTFFGRPHAHHQELNNCSIGLCCWLWYARQQHYYQHVPAVNPEAATAVVELLMMGEEMPEICWATHKRQVINLRKCCIWLVDLFEIIARFWKNEIWENMGRDPRGGQMKRDHFNMCSLSTRTHTWQHCTGK